MLPIISVFIRKYLARAFNNGEEQDATWFASEDAQNADFVTAINQCKARLNAISTAAGSLRYALTSIDTFTATASQTAFTVTTYDSTPGASFVLAWSGSSLIAQASISQTSNTVVTLPAQTVGTVVTIAIYGAGNGTSQLASVTTGQGAGLVGYANTTGLASAANVEDALDELFTDINSSAFIAAIIGLSNYIKKDGTVAFTGNQSMGSHKITNLAAGTAASNDAARMADITSAALQSILGAYLSSTYLALTGGTLSGNLAMGSNKVTGLAAGSTNGDAVRYEQWTNTDATYLTSGLIPAARYTTMVGATGAASGTKGVPSAPTAGQQDYVWYGDATWRPLTTSIGSGHAIFNDTQATTVAGGQLTTATWNKRTLNTTIRNSISGCSITSSVITLPAGSYRVTAFAPAFGVDQHKLRLRNTTDSTDQITGNCHYAKSAGAPDDGGNMAMLSGFFTIAGSKTFELQHYATSTRAVNGAGVPTSDGSNEVYATIEIIRE